MTERPMIMQGDSVLRILDGRKTETRRVVARSNSTCGDSMVDLVFWSQLDFTRAWTDAIHFSDVYLHVPSMDPQYDNAINRIYSKIHPGDKIWVREAYVMETCHEIGWYDPPHSDGRPIRIYCIDGDRWWTQPHYKATDKPPDLTCERHDGGPCCHWRSPLRMPRWASRIDLEVTSVCGERLLDITEESAIAEGISPSSDRSARDLYLDLWQTINGGRAGCSVSDNPWVWATTFRML